MENFDSVKDMLAGYFGITMPDDFLTKVILSNVEIQEEVAAGAVTDTYVRDLIINAVTSELGISVSSADMFGLSGSSNWPCYGDSDEYEAEFYRQLNDKLTELQGATQ